MTLRPPPDDVSVVTPPARVARTKRQLTDAVPISRIEVVVEREAGQTANRPVQLDKEVCRIGSHPSNDVVVADALVSRFHCQLVRDAARWRVVDTGSLNGTVVAGVRVRDGDLPLPECEVRLGDSSLRIRERESPGDEVVPVWPAFGAVVGSSLAMRKLFGLLVKVAQSDSTLLVEGESGTGKEIIVSEIVRTGPRANGPFVVVDCGAMSPNLLENELFGHVRGAYTGADRDRVGAFELADGGTVFLDEVGELPMDMQPKLLRAIEAREVRRVGDSRVRKVDVRVIAATNRRLEREVNHGRFREDLYFRLSVVTVRVPPLRERLDDIPMLVQVFVRALGAEDRAALFSPSVLAGLAAYDWPGNVRELRNWVERAIVLEDPPPASERMSSPYLADSSQGAQPNLELSFKDAKAAVVENFESAYLSALLAFAQGNISLAARKAGMDRMHLHRLVQRYRLKTRG